MGCENRDSHHGAPRLFQPSALRTGRGSRAQARLLRFDKDKGLFDAEYVNIFGVPFTFLPHEAQDGPPPPPPEKGCDNAIMLRRSARSRHFS